MRTCWLSPKAPDAFERFVADGQSEFANQPARAERGQRFAQLHQLRFSGGSSLVGLMMPSTGMREQTGRPLLLVAAPPFAHRRNGRSEKSRRGLDAALLGTFHQPQTVVVSVLHLTNQLKIAETSCLGPEIVVDQRIALGFSALSP